VIEQFFLGDADSVRGYILGERLGDDGFTANAQLRFPVPYVSFAQFGAFIDTGGVRIRDPSPGLKAYYSLTGVGPGLRVNLPYYDAALRVDLGFPLCPDRTQTGSLSGGTSPTPYLGVTARL
jgi:hemolysin activation/secretion protein